MGTRRSFASLRTFFLSPETMVTAAPVLVAYALLPSLWITRGLHHYERLALYPLFFIATGVQLAFVVSSMLIAPDVRLWFVASVVAGMDRYDIGTIVGRQSVGVIVEYLNVSDKPAS
jgi:hypothetical protein